MVVMNFLGDNLSNSLKTYLPASHILHRHRLSDLGTMQIYQSHGRRAGIDSAVNRRSSINHNYTVQQIRKSRGRDAYQVTLVLHCIIDRNNLIPPISLLLKLLPWFHAFTFGDVHFMGVAEAGRHAWLVGWTSIKAIELN